MNPVVNFTAAHSLNLYVSNYLNDWHFQVLQFILKSSALKLHEEYFYMQKKKMSNEIVFYFNEFIFVLLKFQRFGGRFFKS